MLTKSRRRISLQRCSPLDVTLLDAVMDGETLNDAVRDAEMLGDAGTDGDTDHEGDTEADTDGEAVADGEVPKVQVGSEPVRVQVAGSTVCVVLLPE